MILPRTRDSLADRGAPERKNGARCVCWRSRVTCQILRILTEFPLAERDAIWQPVAPAHRRAIECPKYYLELASGFRSGCSSRVSRYRR